MIACSTLKASLTIGIFAISVVCAACGTRSGQNHEQPTKPVAASQLESRLGQPERLATRPPEESQREIAKQADLAPSPKIVNWGPQATIVGTPFNVQPRYGKSAIWFVMENTGPKMKISIDGRVYPLAGRDREFSTLVGDELYRTSGRKEVFAINEVTGHKSASVYFTVKRINAPGE